MLLVLGVWRHRVCILLRLGQRVPSAAVLRVGLVGLLLVRCGWPWLVGGRSLVVLGLVLVSMHPFRRVVLLLFFRATVLRFCELPCWSPVGLCTVWLVL